jgi:hypothetical protein
MSTTDHTPSASPHTTEPWRSGYTPHACNGLPHKVFVDGVDVASCGREPNARRIVTAVNACEGISTHALERGAVAKLLSALQWLVDDLTDAEEDRNPETGDEYDSVTNARAVIAQAKGQ